MAIQFITLLLVAFCVLFILVLSAISGYNVDVEHKDKGWGDGKAYVSVSIHDKLTNGALGFGYESDVFVLNYNPHVKYRDTKEVGNLLGEGDVLLTEDNVNALQERALTSYKRCCYVNLLMTAIGIIILWFVRKWMKRKFYESK